MNEIFVEHVESFRSVITLLMWAGTIFLVVLVFVVHYLTRNKKSRWSGWLASEYETQFGCLEAMPIDTLSLPDDIKNYFRDNHPLIEELGFEMVGDYRVVHGSTPIYARYYWHPDDGTFTEVAVCQTGIIISLIESANARSVTFISVFNDGTCIQTGNAKGPDKPLASLDQLRLIYRPCLTPAQLLNEHRTIVDDYCNEANTQMLEYPPEQLASVSEYYAQMQRELWVDKGIINPPDGFDETASRHGFVHESESADM